MKWIQKGTALAAMLVTAVLCAVPAAAYSSEQIPYDTYAYWTVEDERQARPIRPVYEVQSIRTGEDWGVGPLSNPQDIDCDADGTFYLLDSGNSRVLILDSDANLLRVVDEVLLDGEPAFFHDAQGIYIDRNGLLYIADTMNARVLVLDGEGNVKRVLSQPEGGVIPDDFNFQPIKVVCDSNGYTYVLSSGSYYGALIYGVQGEFLGFYGANTVASSPLELFERLWERLTTTAEKRAASQQRLPYQFISMDITEDDFIYTLTGLTDNIWSVGTGQIRCLNPAGINVMKDREGRLSDSVNFADEGNLKNDAGHYRLTNFTKLCVDEDGFVYALDSTFGHIFIYDEQGQSIAVFGGGHGAGNQMGTFKRPESAAAHNGRLYIIDSLDNTLSIFTRTAYGGLYMQAQALTLKGRSSESAALWKKVLQQDKNNQLAYAGLAQAAILDGDYEGAMGYACQGKMQAEYALAFQRIRDSFMADNVWWMLLAGAAAAVALIVLFVRLRRRAPAERRQQPGHPVAFALATIRHPFDAFSRLKYDGYGSLPAALVTLAVYTLARIASDIYTGFSFQIFDAASYNALITVAGSAGLVLLWSIANWAVCVLFEGKGRFREVLMVSCYAMIPEIMALCLRILLSNLLIHCPGIAADAEYGTQYGTLLL